MEIKSSKQCRYVGWHAPRFVKSHYSLFGLSVNYRSTAAEHTASSFSSAFVCFYVIHIYSESIYHLIFKNNQTAFLQYLASENLSLDCQLYMFLEDSYIDAVITIFLDTIAKANFLPYGIDFGGVPTGRATNGRTVVDFIAQVAGLPFPPPMLGLSETERKIFVSGVNYGSGSSGILPLPPPAVEIFSLFFIHIGTNDLGIYWDLEQKRKFRTAEDYALFLSEELSGRLEAIYQLGARKFLVNNVSPLGCQPFNLNTKMHNTSCVEDVNQRIAFYNGLLPNLLTKLETSLKGSTFVLCDLYKVFEDVYTQPAAYGFTNVNGSCCIDEARNGTRGCARNVAPCADRTSHVFFDPFHPTETSENLSLRLPALYVFGDSYIDAGNNNFLDTITKANFLPYGIDFGGVPTGRATNGRTVVDFIAQVAGLPFPPPMLGLSETERKIFVSGVNYGSGSSGILPLPPPAVEIFGHILSFDEQIELLNDTTRSLKGHFDSPESFSLYLSKSLFFIHTGTNDLGIYWDLEQKRKFRTAEDYALFLSEELSGRLEAYYQLGARKFLVNNVSPLGCQPSI
ncbi:GDSL esterase/lipase 7-like [Durio zibethinus]|uniref:GDSL esterase/lipase 7-like n=1 Tax=Durio zibethinus TaxID=66656 RepID=A0A6P6A5R8_DURZI|nr:GDSL esterase/lipase 7-like [Durio zibethinus]